MTAPVIELRGAARTYPGPPRVPALRPADLAIDAGNYVAVTGPSGSGKSTLLHVLGLLDAPTAGTYLLDGLDTGALGDRDRSALRGGRIGFVFQAFHLLPYRTALENVQLAELYNHTPRGQRLDRAVEALRGVGLGHRLDALPTTLSGGECQRVAIARALVNRPSLLLCDEPTGNLDSRNAATVMELLDELNAAGFTIMVITHDASVASHARRMIAISDGVLSERTEPAMRRARTGLPPSTAAGTRPARRSPGSCSAPAGRCSTYLGTVLGVGAFVAVLGLTATGACEISHQFTVLEDTTVNVQDNGPVNDVAPPGTNPAIGFPADADAIVGPHRRGCRRGRLVAGASLPDGTSFTGSLALSATSSQTISLLATSPGAVRAMGVTMAAVPSRRAATRTTPPCTSR